MESRKSPYAGARIDQWHNITEQLISRHPISKTNIVKAVQCAWKLATSGKIGGYSIGTEIRPRPQIMGFLLHELIPLEIIKLAGSDWRREQDKQDKDVVCISNSVFSFEIKTSSNKNKIFGNRSYGQKATNKNKVTKVDKSGYYLAINFEKFSEDDEVESPQLYKIRFGWIDSEDWKSQLSSTGQQASLTSEVECKKLLTLWEK